MEQHKQCKSRTAICVVRHAWRALVLAEVKDKSSQTSSTRVLEPSWSSARSYWGPLGVLGTKSTIRVLPSVQHSLFRGT
eukprot:5257299-Pyramimonas_sp.AAC.1